MTLRPLSTSPAEVVTAERLASWRPAGLVVMKRPTPRRGFGQLLAEQAVRVSKEVKDFLTGDQLQPAKDMVKKRFDKQFGFWVNE